MLVAVWRSAMPQGRNAIEVDRVSVTFAGAGKRVEALSSMGFEVRWGAWTTLIGPSGCGKTTLLRVLAGLITPDAGFVSVAGAAGRAVSAVASYLPQHDTLLPWRTALDNAILASEIDGRSLGDAKREATDLFAQFGLAGFEDQYPSQLSGGMRQRLALIRAFLAHREILLLDEPLGALDPLTRSSLQDWLLGVWQELRKTVLLVTHDVEEAVMLSDEILLLSPRPASVVRRYDVELPRPRDRSAHDLTDLKAEMLGQLLEVT